MNVLVGVDVCVIVPVGDGVAVEVHDHAGLVAVCVLVPVGEEVAVAVDVLVEVVVGVNVGVMVGVGPEGMNWVSRVTSSKATSKFRFGPFSPS